MIFYCLIFHLTNAKLMGMDKEILLFLSAILSTRTKPD
jgi:hypothetical protein